MEKLPNLAKNVVLIKPIFTLYHRTKSQESGTKTVKSIIKDIYKIIFFNYYQII